MGFEAEVLTEQGRQPFGLLFVSQDLVRPPGATPISGVPIDEIGRFGRFGRVSFHPRSKP
jgi:hypothetical protein